MNILSLGEIHMEESNLRQVVQKQGFAILDGGLASELSRRGAEIDNDPLWSAKELIEHPELIRQVHYDYLVAGADIITSASYQASCEGFAKHVPPIVGKQAIELMQSSITIARQARDKFWGEYASVGEGFSTARFKPFVAASIGPYGAVLHDGSEYSGAYADRMTIDELIEFHRPRLRTLVDAAPDIVAFETIPCLKEIEAISKLIASGATGGLPAWISMSCKDTEHCCKGERVAECVKVVLREVPTGEGVIAIGVNCVAPDLVSPLLREINLALSDCTNFRPLLLAYPNSGDIWDGVRREWKRRVEQHRSLSQLASEWFAVGARIVGGCCRTTPEDIAAIRQSLSRTINQKQQAS